MTHGEAQGASDQGVAQGHGAVHLFTLSLDGFGLTSGRAAVHASEAATSGAVDRI